MTMEISSLGLGVLIGGALVFAALRAKRVEEQGGGGHADSGSGYVQGSRSDEARLDQLPYLLGSWPRLGHAQG